MRQLIFYKSKVEVYYLVINSNFIRLYTIICQNVYKSSRREEKAIKTYIGDEGIFINLSQLLQSFYYRSKATYKGGFTK